MLGGRESRGLRWVAYAGFAFELAIIYAVTLQTMLGTAGFFLAAAVLYRFDTDEPRRQCPTCGHVCMIHDALCTRCGTELDFPDESEILPPVAPA